MTKPWERTGRLARRLRRRLLRELLPRGARPRLRPRRGESGPQAGRRRRRFRVRKAGREPAAVLRGLRLRFSRELHGREDRIPVLRPNHGFLSPAAWRASFAAAGFREVEVLPRCRRRRGALPEVLRRRGRRAALGRARPGAPVFFFVSAGRKGAALDERRDVLDDLRSTCPAFSYSSGVPGPSPATKR